MDACVSASEATSAAWNKHVSEYERQSCLLRAEREALARGFDELEREQDDLVNENEGNEVGDTDLLRINAGGRAITATRRTLTQIKGSRLEALFSGRWEKRLLRDADGRIFLDVNPDCFQALVDYLNERRITPPDAAIDPPDAGEENEIYLERLLYSLGMEDRMTSSAPRESERRDGNEGGAAAVGEWETLTFDEFPEELQLLLGEEQRFLSEAREQLSERRRLFRQEKKMLKYFVGGETKDIVWLDVSGVPMAVKRSTLGMCEDSVLAKQFDDPLWERKGTNDAPSSVKAWTPEQVEAWARTIEGFPSETSTVLWNNDICGVHLLAMGREDFRDLGIKAGALAVLTNAVAELQKSNESVPTFIEHSSYCFGKIVDQLRMRAMQCSPDSFLPVPRVKECEWNRFKTIVGYYFPGESSSFILGDGGRKMETVILTPSHVDQIAAWLGEDGVTASNFELLYCASRDGWKSSDFHSKCDNKGSTLTVVQSTSGYIFGGFADASWSSVRRHVRSPKAFLYGIQTKGFQGPVKLRQLVGHSGNAIFCHPNYGPTFGHGPDLHISNRPDISTSCHADIGTTYCCPSSLSGQCVFTGGGDFSVAELEVFRVVWNHFVSNDLV